MKQETLYASVAAGIVATVLAAGISSAVHLNNNIVGREEVVLRVDRLQKAVGATEGGAPAYLSGVRIVPLNHAGVSLEYDYYSNKGYTPQEIITCIVLAGTRLSCFTGDHPPQSLQRRVILLTDQFGSKEL